MQDHPRLDADNVPDTQIPHSLEQDYLADSYERMVKCASMRIQQPITTTTTQETPTTHTPTSPSFPEAFETAMARGTSTSHAEETPQPPPTPCLEKQKTRAQTEHSQMFDRHRGYPDSQSAGSNNIMLDFDELEEAKRNPDVIASFCTSETPSDAPESRYLDTSTQASPQMTDEQTKTRRHRADNASQTSLTTRGPEHVAWMTPKDDPTKKMRSLVEFRFARLHWRKQRLTSNKTRQCSKEGREPRRRIQESQKGHCIRHLCQKHTRSRR